MLSTLALTSDEVTTLDACSHHSRQRHRAQAVMGHHQGQGLSQLAAFFAVRYTTVHGWLKAWHSQGLVGLCERPPNLPPAQASVKAQA